MKLAVPKKDRIEKRTLGCYEAAAYLGIGFTSLMREVKKGNIPCRKIGQRRYLFTPTALDRWLNEGDNSSSNETGSPNFS